MPPIGMAVNWTKTLPTKARVPTADPGRPRFSSIRGRKGTTGARPGTYVY